MKTQSPTWINLHHHTMYSMLDSVAKLDKYAQHVKELGMGWMCSTDHGNLSAWPGVIETCNQLDLKYILGVESYFARKTRHDRDDEERSFGKAIDGLEQRGPYHLTILAQNLTGYHNLIKLNSRSYLEGYYVKPRADYELLEEYAQGLIVLSGCLSGPVSKALLRNDYNAALAIAGKFQDIVGKDNYFIEIMNHGIPEELAVLPQLIKIGKTIGAKIVATGDTHYVHKEDSDLQDVVACISTSSLKDQENRFKFTPEEFYLRSYEEMSAKFDKEYLQTSVEIAESVELDIKNQGFLFPKFPMPVRKAPEDYLRQSVYIGLHKRYGAELSAEVITRAEYELDVIQQMGFVEYILIVEDVIAWCHKNQIRAQARGSAAGSIVCYALNITGVDPIQYKLIFERFLIVGRVTLPDVDIDVDERYRDRVIQYLRDKYGQDHVSNICNFSTLGAKAALKDVARVLNYPYEMGETLSNLVPPPEQGVAKSLADTLEQAEALELYSKDENVRLIFDTAQGLEGLVRQTGQHAAGILVTPGPIIDYVPVMRFNKKDGTPGPVITQWDGVDIEKHGLLKIDILGLRNLAVIDMAINNIKRSRNEEVIIESIPLTDAKAFNLIQQGKTLGIFQMASPGCAALAQAIAPNSIEDIMAIIALFRPGPLGAHIDKSYIKRKHGQEAVVYPHPKLEKTLSTSLGLMLYQEQILSIAMDLAGWSVADADALRSAVGKKKYEKLSQYREQFVTGCVDCSQTSTALANKIFDDIVYFGRYGFSSNHSCSYSLIGFWTAYLKANYPVEFMAALLASSDEQEDLAKYLNECREMDITVLPPSINNSEKDFTVISQSQILYGMKAIRGLGQAVMDRIMIDNRDYVNIYDFLRKIDGNLENKKTLEHLAFSGALDELVEIEPSNVLMSMNDKMDILNMEAYQLGFYITEHPLESVWSYIENKVTTTIMHFDESYHNQRVTIAGLLTSIEKKITKNGSTFYILQLQDLTSNIEVVSWAEGPGRMIETFEVGNIVLATGRLKVQTLGEVINLKLNLDNMSKVQLPEYGLGTAINLFANQVPASDIVDKMKALINAHPGDSPVYIDFVENNKSIKMKFPKPTSLNIQKQLEDMLI